MTNTYDAPIEIERVSKWYGSVVAVNDTTFQVRPGVTGLLGPNGAGKTTLLGMMCGLIMPSLGSVRVLGQNVRDNPALYRRVGVMREHDALYPFMTGREFVSMAARLQGLDNVAEATQSAIGSANMLDAQDRPTGTYSRGMRQRIRMAAAVVHDPEVLLLDEPLNGTDPAPARGVRRVHRQARCARKNGAHLLAHPGRGGGPRRPHPAGGQRQARRGRKLSCHSRAA